MPLWIAPQPLVLASKSDIRGKILAAAGLRFGIRPGQVDERAIEKEAGVSEPKAVASLLARAKALSAASGHFGHLVLGADQTLALEGHRFDKPANRAEAAAQLHRLRGKTHALHSALALVRDGTVLFECVETAHLTMRDFSDRFLENYLDMVGPLAPASVGAYQLEGVGIHLFDRVDGDYFTILGLPLLPLLKHFRESGYVDG